MSQADIIKLLEKENRWMGIDEIAKKINTNKNNVSKSLRTIYKFGEVLKKKGKIQGIFRLKTLWRAK